MLQFYFFLCTFFLFVFLYLCVLCLMMCFIFSCFLFLYFIIFSVLFLFCIVLFLYLFIYVFLWFLYACRVSLYMCFSVFLFFCVLKFLYLGVFGVTVIFAWFIFYVCVFARGRTVSVCVTESHKVAQYDTERFWFRKHELLGSILPQLSFFRYLRNFGLFFIFVFLHFCIFVYLSKLLHFLCFNLSMFSSVGIF